MQTRVMPLVATAYALNFTALYMQRLAPQAGLTDGDEDDATGMTDDEKAAALPDLHATCAGLKAFATWATYYGLDTLRQCLGGHGYSGYTSMGRMFTDFAVQCTWEGDNTVMALQTARYLVASFERLSKGEPLAGSVLYLESLPRINKAKRTWPRVVRRAIAAVCEASASSSGRPTMDAVRAASSLQQLSPPWGRPLRDWCRTPQAPTL